jgi:DNA-directed RNA polymerase specialized sigma24 family protein
MESDKNTIEAETKVDTDEISLLLIGNQEEQNQAISLIDKHLRKSILYRIRQTGLSLSPEELLDVYQEVLLNIIEAARGKRYDPDQPLLPFIFTLAQRRTIDRIRKMKIRRENESELLDEIAGTLKDTKVGEAWQMVAKKNDGRKMLELMRRAIVRMPRRQRQVAEVIYVRFHEEPAYQEICDEIYEKTGERLTVVMVKGAWREARKKIKEVLIDAGYLEENELGK